MDKLKWWHPIVGLALAELFKIATENLGNSNFQPLFTDIYNWMESIFGLLFIYIILRNIYRSLTKPTIHWEEYDQPHSKPTPSSKIQEIEQELDEIEASLNAVSSNDKVTPIWGGQPPKKP